MLNTTIYDLSGKQAPSSSTSTVSAATVNAFMDQKNKVIQTINAKEFFEAKNLLDILHPLWNTLDYGYKGRELYRYLREEIRKEISEEEKFLASERKNSKVRHSTESYIKELIQLAAEC